MLGRGSNKCWPVQDEMAANRKRLGVLASHPIQYHAPVFRELARRCDLTVFFAHRQTPEGQAEAGFRVPFDWDVDLLSGYEHRFLRNVSKVPTTARFSGCDTPEVSKAIGSGGFDAFLVTGWNLKAYWQAVHACRRQGIPVMVRGDSQLGTHRGPAKKAVKRLAYPWLLTSFARCLYVGRNSQEYYQHYGVDESKLVFSPHCVDNDWFGTRGTEESGNLWRREHGVAPDIPIALFVGKLVERKRPADFLRAIAMLKTASKTPPLALIVGDGDLRVALEELAHASTAETLFLGFRNQTQLPAIYAAANVLCLPSEADETWGLVVNEAMACGTPAVVSNACGCAPDLIEPGRTGFVFPMGDVAALADSVARSLQLKRSPIGKSAIAERVAEYSVSHAADGILQAAASCTRPAEHR
jgi:glycosyltransferase involved in cell wall biosynthesis